ncbi:MAG: Rpn family recombination-promoting nuclease/putative transposase [Oscillospiraceae bacterium]|nr:Rpn family recombination-promoting nuclease/putative transposase [Oscillospiraceae bacterium]
MTKSIETLTIVDDFMFGAVMSDPRLCRPLLELVLGVKIRRIEYPEPQKTIRERRGSKSIRLDVYVEDEAGTVYDVEIQTEQKKGLPKRMRYYQGLIDLHILEKGEDYTGLKKSFVIFICTYDPFGKGRWVYTFENRCREDTGIVLDDGAAKIVLNTKGRIGPISDGLKALLRYMDGSAPEGEYVKALDSAVALVRSDEKWRREYMVLNELLRENVRLGERRRSVAQARKFRDRFDTDELAEFCFVSPKLLRTILDTIDAHPDWDDEQVAEYVDFE